MNYKKCKRCGCSLDPGEANDPCEDCKKEEAELRTQLRPQAKTPIDILALFRSSVKSRGDEAC